MKTLLKDHIHHFSGDKEKVMIFGQSAGGVSVAQHLIQPERNEHSRLNINLYLNLIPAFIFDTHSSQPLFSSVAIHSNPFAIPCKENWLAGIQANYFARDLGCPDLDLDCMRSKTGREVLAAQRFTDNFLNIYIDIV